MIPKYYEYLNKTKIMAGHMALDNLPYELIKRGFKRPIVISLQTREMERGLKILTKAFGGIEGVVVHIYYVDEHSSEQEDQLLHWYKTYHCDAIIALGGHLVLSLGQKLHIRLTQESKEDLLLLGADYTRPRETLPLIAVPTSNSGASIPCEPDMIVLDPRMTMDMSFKEILAWGIDTLAQAIETYTCPMKNPLSDGYAYSAICLVRDNLPRALKCHRDKKARYGLAHAALLSGLAFMNTQTGLSHLLTQAIEEVCHIPYGEALLVILPHQMETFRTRLDPFYGELLLPLAGPDVYADTPSQERGRKAIQTFRSLLEQYHEKHGFPLNLSAFGVTRSDFDGIISACRNNGLVVGLPSETQTEDMYNILNLSF